MTINISKFNAIEKVDTDTNYIYGCILGNKAEEYLLAADGASKYKINGYTGFVPISVQSWANAKRWSAEQAANDILDTRDMWLLAQETIRASRLYRKEQIREAVTQEDIDNALNSWLLFVIMIKSQLNIDYVLPDK